jgi:putative lipase involved disintegration of autophagic bodies
MGTCNGVLSSCALAGYALESRFVLLLIIPLCQLSFETKPCRCHLGTSIIYDTVSNLSWSVNVRTHGILHVIEKVLNMSWAPSEEIGREVPEPVVEDDCMVRSVLPISSIVPFVCTLRRVLS